VTVLALAAAFALLVGVFAKNTDTTEGGAF